jgi:hypothetical protein
MQADPRTLQALFGAFSIIAIRLLWRTGPWRRSTGPDVLRKSIDEPNG